MLRNSRGFRQWNYLVFMRTERGLDQQESLKQLITEWLFLSKISGHFILQIRTNNSEP